MAFQEPKVQLICSPIGNLGDFTYRAVDCLKNADVIACEDTRHSRRLLTHYQISPGELIALHDHNERQKSVELADRLVRSGETLAVLSDAGCPTVSDPGYRLVQESVARSIRVEVIPGPSAVTTALAGSGLPPDKFHFSGFLPVKSGKKEKALREAFEIEGTSIFFESPHRIVKTIQAIHQLDPDRPVCVARELTKKFETFHRGTASEILNEFGEHSVKGEITLLIQGKTRKKPSQERD